MTVQTAPSSKCPRMVLIISFNYWYLWGLVLSEVQWRSRKQNIHLQLLGFADWFEEMDHRAIDTLMVHLQEHLLIPAQNPRLQWLVSKIHQLCSTSHWKWSARDCFWIQLPPRSVSVPQRSPFGVEELVISTVHWLRNFLVFTSLG